MRKYAAFIACALVALTGCSVSVGTDSDEPQPTAEPTVESMTVADLEELVAGSVTPDDEGAEVSAECAGEIDVEVDAAQDLPPHGGRADRRRALRGDRGRRR